MKLREIFEKILSSLERPPEEEARLSPEDARRIVAKEKYEISYRYDRETGRHYWLDIPLPGEPEFQYGAQRFGVKVPDPNDPRSSIFSYSHSRKRGREWSWRGIPIPCQPELSYADNGDIRVTVRYPGDPERILYDRHEDKEGNVVSLEDNRPPRNASGGFELNLPVYRFPG